MHPRAPLALAALTLSLHAGAAVPVSTTVDESQSTVMVTLTLAGGSDSDVSPATGTIAVELDDASAPTQISITGFDVGLSETIDLAISFGFLGSFTGTGTDIALLYPDAPTPVGPAAIGVGGAFAVPGVSTQSLGLINYSATGLACTALINAGLLCASAIDLSASAPVPTTVDGTISIAGNTITISTAFSGSQPLDPANPSLGTLAISGTVVSVGTLPAVCVADLTTTGTTNGVPDGTVNGSDFTFYLALFAGQNAQADLTTTGTTNGQPDGLINGSDFTYFLSLFATGCP